MLNRMLLGVALVAAASVSLAQSFPAPKEVTNLKWMEGTWTGAGKFTMMGESQDCTVSLKNKLDGMFLFSDMTTTVGGVPMTEKSYIGWNAAKKQYDMWAFASFSTSPRIEHGKMEGNAMVFESEPWDVMGMTMISRSTMTKKSDTEVVFKLEFKEGDKWGPAMELTLKKSK